MRTWGMLTIAAALTISGCSPGTVATPAATSTIPTSNSKSTLTERQVVQKAARYLTAAVDSLPSTAYFAVELAENPPFEPSREKCWSGSHAPPDRPQRIKLGYWVGGIGATDVEASIDRLSEALVAQGFTKQPNTAGAEATFRSADGFTIAIDDNEAGEDSLSIIVTTPCVAKSNLDSSESSAPTEIRHSHS
ncbi:hypothetical protein [Smaragdicoccus niigatensis]|uniref:hypothetical protein n=1 Tax=Smaragdicoccus niigatensis TaxID=359359 RepID=UPI000380F979|nr:hypothetical protein [Smaragdicoccus niigatensis]